MKKEKFKLEELKVDSYITSVEGAEQGNVKGGSTTLCTITFSSEPCAVSVFSAITTLDHFSVICTDDYG